MKIENGWAFNSADFSIQAIRNCQSKGRVLFIRAHPDYSRWFEMEQELKEADDGPPLYVVGYGMTLGEAITNANLAAAHAKPIPAL